MPDHIKLPLCLQRPDLAIITGKSRTIGHLVDELRAEGRWPIPGVPDPFASESGPQS